MRRRSFRPTLESLDFRITPSDMGPVGVAVTVPKASTVVIDDGSNDNPLWNEPSDPADPTSGPDDGYLWCPPIGA